MGKYFVKNEIKGGLFWCIESSLAREGEAKNENWSPRKARLPAADYAPLSVRKEPGHLLERSGLDLRTRLERGAEIEPNNNNTTNNLITQQIKDIKC